MREKGIKGKLNPGRDKYFIQVTKKIFFKYTNDEKEMKYCTFITR